MFIVSIVVHVVVVISTVSIHWTVFLIAIAVVFLVVCGKLVQIDPVWSRSNVASEHKLQHLSQLFFVVVAEPVELLLQLVVVYARILVQVAAVLTLEQATLQH